MTRRSRFFRLEDSLAHRKGRRRVRNPRALAAWIGRRKYGRKRFAAMSHRRR
jgi:hypothetical protein